MTADAAKILERARDVLESGGWTRHRMIGTDGSHCISGALVEAGRQLRLTTSYPMGYALDAVRTHAGPMLTVFNDEEAESVEDVLLVLKQAQADLEGESA